MLKHLLSSALKGDTIHYDNIGPVLFVLQSLVLRGKGKPRRNQTTEAPLTLPQTDLKGEQEREEKELEHLRELYPDEFAELYQAALENCPLFIKKSGGGAFFVERRALMELRQRHGIVK